MDNNDQAFRCVKRNFRRFGRPHAAGYVVAFISGGGQRVRLGRAFAWARLLPPRAGLVQKSRDAQRRPCRINAEPLKQATDWMAQYRQFWEGSLDRLDAYLQQLQAVEIAQNSAAQALTEKPSVNVSPATVAPDNPSFKTVAKKARNQKHTTSKPTPPRKTP